MALEIKIKYFDREDYKCPRLKAIQKGNWIDLYASEDTFVSYHTDPENRTPTLIPLGIAMKLPDGYEAHLAPRSSTYKNWGTIQTNSFGIIDTSYCGDNDMWKLPVICLKPNSYKEYKGVFGRNRIPGTWIHAGDKIAQFRIVESMPELTFVETDHLEDEDRGGFGSTGTN